VRPEWTREQIADYERTGTEYASLVLAVRAASPTLEAAESALCVRLLTDVGKIVRTVYYTKFVGLEGLQKFDYARDAEDATSEYAAFIMEGVRNGDFETGRNVLGFRSYMLPSLRRRANNQIAAAGKISPLFSDDEDGSICINPALRHAQRPCMALLPLELLESITPRDRDVLAALDAHGYDRESTAAYFVMTIGTFNTLLQRITKKMRSAADQQGNGRS
jgi:DNA-directed RNA polymerase specialized sigma24 family protein